MAQRTATQSAPEAANEAEQVRRALTRDAAALRVIMQSHNRRLYRIARSILRNNADAERGSTKSISTSQYPFLTVGGITGCLRLTFGFRFE